MRAKDRRFVHVEHFVGRWVLDEAGERIGRIEEVRAKREGRELVVVDYLLGSAAALERFSAWGLTAELLRLVGLGKPSGCVVPWDRLDLSDPACPRCLCLAEELEHFVGRPRPLD
jgi:hypothetical protein